MKNNKGIFGFIILIVCLISCIVLIKFVFPKEEETVCESFEYNDIIYEINSATDANFVATENMSQYIPVNFYADADYVFVLDDQTEQDYFVLVRNISQDDLSELESFVKSAESEEKNIEIKEFGIYTYIVSSEKFSSTIDGIIRSFIFCS